MKPKDPPTKQRKQRPPPKKKQTKLEDLLSFLDCRLSFFSVRGKTPKPEWYFRRQAAFRLSSIFRSRPRNCWTLMRPVMERAIRYAWWGRIMRPKYGRFLRNLRIAAGTMPFGNTYEGTIENLAKMNVLLNRKILADMAIWEPHTFKTISTLANRRAEMDREVSRFQQMSRRFQVDSVLGTDYLNC